MKPNEYHAAEVVEMGQPAEIILGWKDSPDLDSSGGPPLDRHYHESASNDE